jgi:GNAT superfamily N-acetyltransferase
MSRLTVVVPRTKMSIEATNVPVEEILPFRELYRREMNAQIRHDSFPRRGFSDAYLLRIGGRTAGYGLVANRHYPGHVHEFYVLPAHRASALPLFREFLEASGATYVMAQTNDRLLTMLLYDCAENITSDAIMFEDAFTTHLACPEGVLRRTTEADLAHFQEEALEAVPDWVIESAGAIIANGGALFHYNPPFADLFMEVAETHRRRGLGSYLVQELKRICYEMGKVPAARCSVSNVASRKTLEKAGMLPCARVLIGEVSRR